MEKKKRVKKEFKDEDIYELRQFVENTRKHSEAMIMRTIKYKKRLKKENFEKINAVLLQLISSYNSMELLLNDSGVKPKIFIKEFDKLRNLSEELKDIFYPKRKGRRQYKKEHKEWLIAKYGNLNKKNS